jgi:hypothetical protein
LLAVERIGADHFRDCAQFPVSLGVSGDYPALKTSAAQPLGDMPADET